MAVGGPCPNVLGSLRNEGKYLTVLAYLALAGVKEKGVVGFATHPEYVSNFLLTG